MSSSSQKHGASLRDTFSDPNGDTLIYVESPLITEHLQRPMRASSSVLQSPEFQRHLGPTNQFRLLRRKKLLQNGLPMGVKFVMDLSPPQEGDEAVDIMEKLWCPESVREWKQMNTKIRVYDEPDDGHAETELEIPSELDNFFMKNWGGNNLKEKKVVPKWDVFDKSAAELDEDMLAPLPPDTQLDEPMELESVNNTKYLQDETQKHTAYKQASLTWSGPPAYSVERHVAAVERVIGMLNGVNPQIYSATMWYTVYRVAVLMKCAPKIVDYIVRWIYDGNEAFVEFFTPLVIEIAEEIQAECLFRECFALTVARELVCEDIHGNGFYSVERGGTTQKWRRSIDAATSSLRTRIPRTWNELFGFSWLEDSSKIPSMEVLNKVLRAPMGEYSPVFVESTKNLKNYIGQLVVKPMMDILQGKGQTPFAPPAPPPSVTPEVWDEWRDQVFNSCRLESAQMYSRYAWMKIRDISWYAYERDYSQAVHRTMYWKSLARQARVGEWIPKDLRKPEPEGESNEKTEAATTSPGRKRTAEMSGDGGDQIEQPPAQKRSVLEVRTQPPNSEKHLNIGDECNALIRKAFSSNKTYKVEDPELEPGPLDEMPLLTREAIIDFDSFSEKYEDDDASPVSPTYEPTTNPPSPIRQIADSILIHFGMKAPTIPPYRACLRDIDIADVKLLPELTWEGKEEKGKERAEDFHRNPTLEITVSHPPFSPNAVNYERSKFPELPIEIPPGCYSHPVSVTWYTLPEAAEFHLEKIVNECQDYLRRMALDVCTNSIGWEFMNFQLLTCLDEREWQFLPIWAGGLDDGSGVVFGDIPTMPEVNSESILEAGDISDTDGDGESTVGSYSIIGSQSTGELIDMDTPSGSTVTWSEVGSEAGAWDRTPTASEDGEATEREEEDEQEEEESDAFEFDAGWEDEMRF